MQPAGDEPGGTGVVEAPVFKDGQIVKEGKVITAGNAFTQLSGWRVGGGALMEEAGRRLAADCILLGIYRGMAVAGVRAG